MEKRRRNMSQIKKDLNLLDQAYKVTQKFDRISEIHPNNDPRLALNIEIKKCRPNNGRNLSMIDNQMTDGSIALTQKKRITERNNKSLYCNDKRHNWMSLNQNETDLTSKNEPSAVENLMESLDGRQGQTPVASDYHKHTFKHLETNSESVDTPSFQCNEKADGFSEKLTEDYLRRIALLEQENLALKKANLEIQHLYENSLEELDWYYQRYGRKDLKQTAKQQNQQEQIYEESVLKEELYKAPTVLNEASHNAPKTSRNLSLTNAGGIHRQINTLQARIAQATDRLKQKHKFRGHCYNESAPTMKDFEDKIKTTGKENHNGKHKNGKIVSRSHARRSHRDPNTSSSSPSLISKLIKSKGKKKRNYKKIPTENYYKSNKPVKMSEVLAPTKNFKEYNTNFG
ncbi:unnamed protein product [Moneuplotes crassus]|uniref:Uncharacterized protein n=1 Tax=Euplotes crassus TaxID=5936 RepID=A0AAD1UIG1_EUPCR|nr:unnamed protein product [Moneuplotes crassus]